MVENGLATKLLCKIIIPNGESQFTLEKSQVSAGTSCCSARSSAPAATRYCYHCYCPPPLMLVDDQERREWSAPTTKWHISLRTDMWSSPCRQAQCSLLEPWYEKERRKGSTWWDLRREWARISWRRWRAPPEIVRESLRSWEGKGGRDREGQEEIKCLRGERKGGKY